MNSLEGDLDRLSKELATAEEELARLTARVEGLRAERNALARSIAAARSALERVDEPLAEMTKADAIVAVLRRSSPATLRTPELVEALRAGGRPHEGARTISVYLDSLLKEQRIIRVARGEYTVPTVSESPAER